MLETAKVPDDIKKLGDFGFAGEDHVIPFEVGPLDARGRVIALGPVLDAILARHSYPEPVARLVAEACLIAVLLGSSLKFEGKFILQTRTDGPVDMLVADFSTPGSLRAYAQFDADRLDALTAAGETSAQTLLGSGMLALTIDQGAYMQRYQGIVELDGKTLQEAAHDYFRQSEQIPTEIRLEVAKLVRPGEGEKWRAGGLIAQFLPEASERMRMGDLPGGDGAPEAEAEVDNAWREVQALAATIEPGEMIDPTIEPERLLYRLFHEHGVRVFPGVQVADRCSCSQERIRGILEGFSAEEIAESTEDGRIAVSCEFCSTTYEFDPADFAEAN
jgi:molecular chaperone Hsp33